MIEVTWLGHSTFELRLDNGEVLVTDPWVEGNPKHPEKHKFEKVDSMIISHGHFDHFHDAVPLAKKYDTKVAAIFEIATYMESKKVKTATPMNKGGSIMLNSVKVTMTHAIHSSCMVDGSEVEYGGEPAGFVLRIPDGRNIYFAGDTSAFMDMQLIKRLYQPEIAFLPIGDVFTMGPKEAALACELIGARTVIPMHYGTFPQLTGTPEQLKDSLGSASEFQVRVFTPGETQQL